MLTDAGWRDLAVAARPRGHRAAGASDIPSYHLGVLGMPGLTAYAGLFRIAGFHGATPCSCPAPPVRSAAWSASSPGSAAPSSAAPAAPEKVAVADRRARLRPPPSTTTTARSPTASRPPPPTGSTSTSTTSAASTSRPRSARSRLNGRGGAVRLDLRYNVATPPPGPRNLSMMVAKRLTLRGFLVVRPRRPAAGVRGDGLRLAAVRAAGRPRDRARGSGGRRPGIPGPAAGRQHREDGRAARRGRLTGPSR